MTVVLSALLLVTVAQADGSSSGSDVAVVEDAPAEQAVASDWPIGGALGARIFCVEGMESAHGRYMWNPQGWPPPYYREHAQGWLGWLPSTARTWGVTIGDRASEWAGAARMIAAGAGSQFAGIAWGRC